MKTIAFALSLLLAGCASITGVGLVTESVSSFDNSKIIEASPGYLYDETRGMFDPIPFRLGARWNSASPEHAALVISYAPNGLTTHKSFTNIQGIDLNIDGNISNHNVDGITNHQASDYNTVAKQIYTSSSNVVIIPLATLDQLVSAKDSRIRIRSMDGFIDAHFSIEQIPGASETAIVPIRDLLARVKAEKAARAK